MSKDSFTPNLHLQETRLTARGERLLKIGRDIASVAAATIVAGAVIPRAGDAIGDINPGPRFVGETTYTVEPGDTLDGISNSIDGGASHTGEVSFHISINPENASVFQNSQLDPGEELIIPERVE